MAFLLRARFNSNGCSTDSGLVNIDSGGNIYTEKSCLKNGDKCVTFLPYNYNAGLKKNVSISLGQQFTVYMKYKINKDYLIDDIIPIITYTTNSKPNAYKYFVCIQEKKYFSILLNDTEGFSSKIVDYTFDNRWHTLCITRDSSNKVRMFIDGFATTKNTSKGASISLGNTIYLGKFKPTTTDSVTLDGGSLDDICILDTCVYKDDFVPPTMYFTGTDSRDNYKYFNKSNTDNISPAVQHAVEEKMFSTATHINNRQMGWLPRRLRIRWYEHTRQYFRNEEYNWTKPRPNATIINLYGLEIPYIYGYDRYRFMEGNAYRLWQQNKILAFVLFVNGKFIKLSDIDMVKSDWWLTIFIKGRDPRFNDRVNSVEIIIIPFPVIYEEGLGERENIPPLYAFNDQGLFESSNGYTFYYIDKDKAPKGLDHIGIQDQYIPSISEDNSNGEDEDYNDSMFMHNIWRYGTLTRVSTSGKSGIYRFNCTSDTRHIQPGDQINLYMHTVYISPDRYRISGQDQLEFYDYKDNNIDNFVVTMQLITDNRNWELQDLTNTRFESVTAEIDNQSVFSIPQVVDSDGYPYRYFLIFRGSICIMNKDRYVISDDNTTLTFTNTEDFVPKGTKLYFVFVKILRADQFGPLHVKPIFLTTIADPDTTGNFGETFTYKVKIPDLKGLKYNKQNVMMFMQNTFISPERYEISDNTVTMTKYSGDHFLRGKHITFVLLKMVNKFEDPLDDHDKVVYEQVQKGRRYVLYELPIDKRRQITIDNFVTFDNQGYYIPNLFGEVMNRNIIKEIHSDDPLHIVPRYLTCVYSTDSLDNESNSLIPTNDDYIAGYITLRQEYYELDDHFEEFMSDFDISYDKNVHYGQNLAKALDYITCYNQNKLDKAYEKLSIVDRITYTGTHFNSLLSSIPRKLKNELELPDNLKFYMELDREYFWDSYYRSYPIYFVNGIVPNWYLNTTYKGNRMLIFMESKPSNSDTIELLLFRKIKNYLYRMNSQIHQ